MSRLCLKHADASARPAAIGLCSVCQLLHARRVLTEQVEDLRTALMQAGNPHGQGCITNDDGCSCGVEALLEAR